MYDIRRGKVRFVCRVSGCGFQSQKADTIDQARRIEAVHNFNCHPGVFPRLNPNPKAAIERRAHGADT